MKLRQYTGENGSVLILDAGGGVPDRREWQTMCCRSLTLPVDTLLVGPMNREPPWFVMVLDTDGLTVPLTEREAQVFARFLRDEGYTEKTAVAVTDGKKLIHGIPEAGWWQVTAPEGQRLRRLLGL